MPFDRPDLQTLIQRTLTDLNSRFEGAYNRLRRRVNAVYARVLAGLAHGIYGYQQWASQQILPDTQDDDHLLRFGIVFGVQRIAAASAQGSVTATGTDGSVIEAGALWQRADGIEYTTVSDATIAAGSAQVDVVAAGPGADANTDAPENLSLVSPVSGVDTSAAITAGGISGGRDIEEIETYRSRVLRRTAIFFTGANQAVYVKWAKEVAGVTRAWCYENTPTAGEVTVLFVCDDQPGGIIPDAAKITEVEDYLEEHTDPITGQVVGRAVNVTLVVDGPVADEIDFTITPSPDTAAVRAAIEAELTDLIRREAEPGGTILISHIRQTISNAAGEVDYILTAPGADVASAAGEIAIMGTITWT